MRQGHPRPVFLDRTGRRRRAVIVGGAGLAVVLVTGLVLLIVALSGGSGWSLPGFPDANGVPAPTPTPTPTPVVEQGVDPGSVLPGSTANRSTPTTDATQNRRVPTQTPTHPNKPTKT